MKKQKKKKTFKQNLIIAAQIGLCGLIGLMFGIMYIYGTNLELSL